MEPTIWLILLLILMTILLIKQICWPQQQHQTEGFDNNEFVFLEGDQLYDQFYVNIYDQLAFNSLKNDYEVGQITASTTPTSRSIILDIGSATGHHVNQFTQKGMKNITGLDKSEAMIKKAKENYPTCKFVLGNALDTVQFHPDTFTHILCLYFTIYYMQDKSQFFQNCFQWLMPGGYLVVHLVDPKQFDPILPPANPLLIFTPQRYAEKRITTSNIAFDDFKYKSDFVFGESDGKCKFVEKFENKKTGKVFRKQEHVVFMESENEILQLAQEIGFIAHGKIDLIKSGYEYNTLYILLKPN
jgi:SAM-dependent methyltransferase